MDAIKLPTTLPGHWETAEGLDKAREYATKSRCDLAMSDRTDLGLANALYLVSGEIAIQTAAKERMRWLSVQLAIADARVEKLRALALTGSGMNVAIYSADILAITDAGRAALAEAQG